MAKVKMRAPLCSLVSGGLLTVCWALLEEPEQLINTTRTHTHTFAKRTMRRRRKGRPRRQMVSNDRGPLRFFFFFFFTFQVLVPCALCVCICDLVIDRSVPAAAFCSPLFYFLYCNRQLRRADFYLATNQPTNKQHWNILSTQSTWNSS